MAMNSTIRKNSYNKKVYEQIPIRVKKGEKEGISQCAQFYGMSCVTRLLQAKFWATATEDIPALRAMLQRCAEQEK